MMHFQDFFKLRLIKNPLILCLALALALPSAVVAKDPNLAPPATAEAAAVESVAQVAPKHHKIIIFYASIGNGHLSATKAIADAYKKMDPNAEIFIKDARDFQPEWRKKVVNRYYDFATKFVPSRYDEWYESMMKEAEKIDSLGNLGIVDGQRPKGYLKYIKEVDPTLIISTQNHITEVIHRLRDEGELRNIPTAQVLTDYTPTSYFRRLGDKVDMSFVPHVAIEKKFIAEGMPKEKVRTSGIPVNPKLFEPMSAEARAKFLQANGLDPEKPTILISSGSAGVGNYQTMVESVVGTFKEPIQIVAVNGRSEMNFNRLEKMLKSGALPKNVVLKNLPLVPQDEMLNYLKASDVMIGKSGGLTSTEISALGKKAVLLDINGGQESYNSRFFEENHLSLMTKDLKQVGPLAQRLLKDKQLQDQISAAQAEIRAHINPDVVAEWISEQRKIPLSKSELFPLRPRGPPGAAGGSGEASQEKAAIMWNEREVASARLQLYEKADSQLYATYYLHDGNKAGMVHFAELRDAARRMKAQGKEVNVKLMIDGWGPERWVDAKIDPAVIKALAKEGIEVKIFNPVNLESKKTYLDPNSFKRSHEKTAIIDGQYVILGDRNVQNINFRLQKTSGKTGSSYQSAESVAFSEFAAKDATEHFLSQFNGPLAKPVETANVTDEQVRLAERNLDRYSELLQSDAFKQLKSEVKLENKLVPVKSVTYLHDYAGTDGYKRAGKGMEEAMLTLLKSSDGEVRLTSPYVRPSKEWKSAFDELLAQGRKVRIQTVSEKTTDAPIASKAFALEADKLTQSGVEVLLHQGPDFAHAKLLEAGRILNPETGKFEGERRTLVMSHNINPRSANTDFESGILVEGDEFAKQVRAFTDELAKNSKPFEKNPAPFADCFKQEVMRVLIKAPVIRDQL